MRRLDQKGFTITELTIAMVVAIILSVAMTSIIIIFYGGILKSDVRSRMTVDSQIILRNLVDELRVSSHIRDTNINTDANAPTGGWSTSSTNAILIVGIPAVDSDQKFILDENNDPYENEIIYFAEEETLYRRVLAHPLAVGTSLTTTCPESVATVSCPADRVLSTDYQNLSFVFYDTDNATTIVTDDARSVEMTIELGREVFGELVGTDNDIRVTLRNGQSG